jgi:hypothetical protein
MPVLIDLALWLAWDNRAGGRARRCQSSGGRATLLLEYADRIEFPDRRLRLCARQAGVDPNLSIADTKFHSSTGLLAYVRSFDFAGQSAKFDVIVPGSSFDAQGLVKGRPREREMAGLGDPRFRFSATTPISSAATDLRRHRSMRFRRISFIHFSRVSGWPWTGSILRVATPP